MADGERFHPLFERWARRVRSRLLVRRLLTGFALGLVVGAAGAAGAWWTGHGTLRPFGALAGLAGLAFGAAVARRRRWTDVDVALWLDDRLETEEAITTAVELRNQAEDDDEARAVVVSTAATALAGAEGKARAGRPGVLRPLHALAPLAIVALVLVARQPLPVHPVPAQAPGEARVQLSEVEGLKKVAELGQATARDDAQKERLEKIAKDAEKLRADLDKGLERREALDRIAKLRDEIAAERLTLGEGEKRAGLEAAMSKLEQSDVTKEAARALGDHDLERMDREMERIANAREKRDREAAKRALEDAAAAAKSSGAPDVGKSLQDQKKGLEERERRAEALRDLEKAMEDSGLASPEQKSEAEALDRKGSDEAARKLADAMGKALEKLTPEERQRLAEKLKKQARSGGSQADPRSLKDLADDLATPEGQKQLEDQLKDMAKEDDESAESKGQKQLDDAEEGTDGAEDDVNGQKPGQQGQPGQEGQDGQGQQGQGQGQPGPGQGGQHGKSGHGKVPIPIPMPGQGQQGQGQGSGSGDGDQPGGGGHHHDTGTGSHDGRTDGVEAGTLRSRARGPLNRAQGMPGSTTGRLPGRSGGTANVQGTGALGAAAPSEIDGVDHSDVPEEYREQVRQYFQP